MKKKIAVIFGGKSVEHEVSILTAHIPIMAALEATDKFDVIPLYISKDGSWYSEEGMKDLEYFRDKDFENKIAKAKKVRLLFDRGLKISKAGMFPKDIKIDVAFPAMHGTYGEDGSLMGLLRLANVPYVGCDMFSSAIAMDKAVTKQILSDQRINIVPYVAFTKYEWKNSKKKLLDDIKKLEFPLFVKPVHLGSSIAITKTKDRQELLNAIEVAFHYDNKILIEKSVENLIEVTLPIMGNEELISGGIERALNKSEFFNFSDKYLSGAKKGQNSQTRYSEIPAKIGEELSKKVKKMGEDAYKAIGCSGIARVDFLIDKSEELVYVNEINTLPGSLYHHNWKEMGISPIELVTKLINLAEERFEAEKNTNYTFKSSILNKVTGSKINNYNE